MTLRPDPRDPLMPLHKVVGRITGMAEIAELCGISRALAMICDRLQVEGVTPPELERLKELVQAADRITDRIVPSHLAALPTHHHHEDQAFILPE